MAPNRNIYRTEYWGDADKYVPKDLRDFFFVRHGQTDWNVQGFAQGQADTSLNATGKQQALQAAPIIKALPVKRVLSSELSRAVETADLVTQGMDLEVQVDDAFKERSFGAYEGKIPPAGLYYEDLETTEPRQDFGRRIAKGLRHCQEPGSLIVAHGCVLRTIIGLLDTDITCCDDLGNAQVLFFKKTEVGLWEVKNFSAAVIKSVRAIEAIDSNGRPIVEVTTMTARGAKGMEASPTGVTVGAYEPHVLRDGDKTRYNGLGVTKAVDIVNTIIGPALEGMNVFCQEEIDTRLRQLDDTSDMSKLGGNSICSTSASVWRAAAATAGFEDWEFPSFGPPKCLPVPVFNIINGKRKGDRNDLTYEHIVVPIAENYPEAVRMGKEIHTALARVIEDYSGKPALAGASGGYEAPTDDSSQVIDLLEQAAIKCGYGDKVAFAVDGAAADVYRDGTYPFKGTRKTAAELLPFFEELSRKHKMVFMEDLFDEEAFGDFAAARKQIPRTVIAGDDLTVTQVSRMERADECAAIEGFIFKPGQAGTVTEALAALELATEKGWMVAASARGGGPMTDIVRPLSLGLGKVHFYKAGAPTNGGHRTQALCEGMGIYYTHGTPLADIKPFLRFK